MELNAQAFSSSSWLLRQLDNVHTKSHDEVMALKGQLRHLDPRNFIRVFSEYFKRSTNEQTCYGKLLLDEVLEERVAADAHPLDLAFKTAQASSRRFYADISAETQASRQGAKFSPVLRDAMAVKSSGRMIAEPATPQSAPPATLTRTKRVDVPARLLGLFIRQKEALAR